MKIILVTTVLIISVSCSFAQTNTFPTTGNVGIGTTSPGSLLDVNGQSRFRNFLTANFGTSNRSLQLRDNGLFLSRTSDGTYVSSITADGSMYFDTRNHYIFRIDGVETFTITEPKNFGIGNSNPTAKLEINSSSVSTFASGFNNNLRLNGIAPGMQFWDLDHNTGWQICEDGGDLAFGQLFTQTALYGSSLVLKSGGRVRIGALNRSEADAQLSVDGIIYTKKIKVTQTGWADYVFEPNYSLLPLPAVEAFILKNKHLPGIPSAEIVEKVGADIGDTQVLLLQKIEELTLYIIELNKKIELLQKESEELKKKQGIR